MYWGIQGGCSAVHAGWNASPEEAEIPSTFSPFLFFGFQPSLPRKGQKLYYA